MDNSRSCPVDCPGLQSAWFGWADSKGGNAQGRCPLGVPFCSGWNAAVRPARAMPSLARAIELIGRPPAPPPGQAAPEAVPEVVAPSSPASPAAAKRRTARLRPLSDEAPVFRFASALDTRAG